MEFVPKLCHAVPTVLPSDITMLTENRSLSFAVSNGWYHFIILSYIDDVLGKTFGLHLIPTEEKPIFKGNMATDYGF